MMLTGDVAVDPSSIVLHSIRISDIDGSGSAFSALYTAPPNHVSQIATVEVRRSAVGIRGPKSYCRSFPENGIELEICRHGLC